MTDSHITLGGQQFPVTAQPLGVMKKLTPAVVDFSRTAAQLGSVQNLTEQDFDKAILAVSLGLGKTVDEVEAIKGVVITELIDAVQVLAEVAGLVPRGGPVGESKPAAIPATDSTPSTD